MTEFKKLPCPRLGLGLAPRLIGLVVLVGLVAGGLVSAVAMEKSREALRQEDLTEKLAAVDLAAEFTSSYVEAAQMSVQELAGRATVVSAVLNGTPERAATELAWFLRGHPRIDNVAIYDVNGIGLVSGTAGSQAVGSSVVDREWLRQVMATGQPYLGVPIISRETRHPIEPYGVPITDERGTVRAVLGGPISIAVLSEVILGIASSPSIRADLLDLRQGGIILAHVDPSRVLQPVAGRNDAALRLVAGERGVLETVSSSGEMVLAAFSPVPHVPWGVLILEPSEQAFAPLDALTRHILLLTGLATLIAAALAGLLAFRMSHPLVLLRNAANEIAAGNLTCRLNFTGHDELADVGRAFDQMVAALSKRTAQLEAANKELEEFSYSVSHDLRAPLRAVDGFSRILLEEHRLQLSPEAQRYLRLVRENTQQMGHLIEDLLAFSRLSRQPVNRQPVSPTALVRQTLADLGRDQEGRRVEISIGDLPNCLADPALLKQVLVNLLSNALKFTRQREVAVIEIGCREENGEQVYFVKDNGVGFDMRYAHNLFGVFQRLHRAEDFDGTGVGLAIVQRIINRHDGRVWAEGAVNQGATFYFTIPGGTP